MLGFVQGITEFLPISSTAHLRIVPAFLGWEDPGAAFTAVTQLGTMAASSSSSAPTSRASSSPGCAACATPCPPDARLAHRLVRRRRHDPDRHLRARLPRPDRDGRAQPAADRRRPDRPRARAPYAEHVSNAQPRDRVPDDARRHPDRRRAGCALIPGVSRSGATITGGLFLGLDRTSAARYSFLLSIPAVMLSGLLELRHATEGNGPGAGADDHRDADRVRRRLCLDRLAAAIPDVALDARLRGLPRGRRRDRPRAGDNRDHFLMLVIVAALGAAASWGISAAFDNRSTRLIGALQALAWVQVIGFFLVLPMAVWEGTPSQPSARSLAWIAVGGVGVCVGPHVLVRRARPRGRVRGRLGHRRRRSAGRTREHRARRAHRHRHRGRARHRGRRHARRSCMRRPRRSAPASRDIRSRLSCSRPLRPAASASSCSR